MKTKCHRENPRAELGCNSKWEPGVSSGRSKITHLIYISKSLCIPRSLSKIYFYHFDIPLAMRGKRNFKMIIDLVGFGKEH